MVIQNKNEERINPATLEGQEAIVNAIQNIEVPAPPAAEGGATEITLIAVKTAIENIEIPAPENGALETGGNLAAILAKLIAAPATEATLVTLTAKKPGIYKPTGVTLTRPSDTTSYALKDAIGFPAVAISGASNANPIEITSNAHGLVTGDCVTIASVGGNTNANGNWSITKTGDNTFTIPVAGNSNYTSGGTFQKIIRFANSARSTGLGGWIVKVRAHTNRKEWTGNTIRCHFFHSQPTLVADNAQYAYLYANKDKRIGYIDITLEDSAATGQDSTTGFNAKDFLPFKLDGTDLFMQPVLYTGSVLTSASGQEIYFEILTDQD
jgi:hypothetical protein